MFTMGCQSNTVFDGGDDGDEFIHGPTPQNMLDLRNTWYGELKHAKCRNLARNS